MSMTSDNQGGITYSSTGGLSVDLSDAALEATTQQALTFAQNNTNAGLGFEQNVINQSGDEVAASTANATQYSNNVLGFLSGLSENFKSVVKNISQQTASGCFITTAVCESEGLPDDCEDLQTLRKFRDEVMLKNAYWSKLVSRYYAVAPGIVEKLNAMPERDAIYAELRKVFIGPCICLIKGGWHDAAIEIYENMVDLLTELVADDE